MSTNLLKFCTWNIRGLLGLGYNKLVYPEVVNLIQEQDIIAFLESWSCIDQPLDFPDYDLINVPRATSNRFAKRLFGGICIYIKKSIMDLVTVHKKSDDKLIWLIYDKLIIIGIVYNPPGGPHHEEHFNIRLEEELKNIISSTGIKSCIIGGDFNVHVGNLQDDFDIDVTDYDRLPDDADCFVLPPRVVSHTKSCPKGVLFVNTCINNKLAILNGRKGLSSGDYTYDSGNSETTVDYHLVSHDMLKCIDELIIGDKFWFTDHRALRSVVILDKTRAIKHDRIRVKRIKWSQSSCSAVNDAIIDVLPILRDTVISTLNIDDCIANFTDQVMGAVFPIVGKVMYVGGPPRKARFTGYCTDCGKLRKTYYEAFRKWHDDRKNETVHDCWKSAERAFKRHYKKCELKSIIDRSNAVMEHRYANVREWWKALEVKKSSIVTDLDADAFCKHFGAVNNPSDMSYFNLNEDVKKFNKGDKSFEIKFPELNNNITLEELIKSIRSLKNGKACGKDLWVNELLKNIECIRPSLLIIFNRILDTGVYPIEWSTGIVQPVHKKGSLNDPSNYRGITLISVVGKLFTGILNKRLVQWADKNGIIFEGQSGFRPAHSTIDNIFIVNAAVRKFLNNGNKLYGLFIDFKKCFDLIVRDNVYYKLAELGVQGKIVNVIRGLYKNVKSVVRLNGKTSSNGFLCTIGLLQGEPLSPVLFSFLVNDMASFIREKLNDEVIKWGDVKLYLLLFADDSLYLASSPTKFQEGINYILEYCTKWNLKVNTDKTKVMVFRRTRVVCRETFTYGDVPLETVDNMGYLGMQIKYDGTWVNNYNTRLAKARRAYGCLKRRLYHFRFSPSTVFDLYNGLVESVLLYGGEIWGVKTPKTINNLQLQCIKETLRVKKCTPSNFLWSETGLLPTSYMLIYRMLCYWSNLVSVNTSKFSKSIYFALLESNIDWIECVKKHLYDLGLENHWVDNVIVHRDKFKADVKKALYKKLYNQCINSFTTSKSSIYKGLFMDKDIKSPVWYVKYCRVPETFRALASLRLRSHRLLVETGAWCTKDKVKVDFINRLCPSCNKLEDEFHFVLECINYKAIRKKFIPRDVYKKPSMHKLVKLLGSDDILVVNRLGNYIRKAYAVRLRLFNVIDGDA